MLGPGSDLTTRLSAELVVVLHITGLEGVKNQPGVLDEPLTTGVHVDAEALVFDASQTSTDAENHAPSGHLIEKRNLLSDSKRIVPWQNHYS